MHERAAVVVEGYLSDDGQGMGNTASQGRLSEQQFDAAAQLYALELRAKCFGDAHGALQWLQSHAGQLSQARLRAIGDAIQQQAQGKAVKGRTSTHVVAESQAGGRLCSRQLKNPGGPERQSAAAHDGAKEAGQSGDAETMGLDGRDADGDQAAALTLYERLLSGVSAAWRGVSGVWWQGPDGSAIGQQAPGVLSVSQATGIGLCIAVLSYAAYSERKPLGRSLRRATRRAWGGLAELLSLALVLNPSPLATAAAGNVWERPASL
jgi:hypothetical protein